MLLRMQNLSFLIDKEFHQANDTGCSVEMCPAQLLYTEKISMQTM